MSRYHICSQDTPPVISNDDGGDDIVKVPHEKETNKLYHKNDLSWEEQIATTSCEKLEWDDIFDTPEPKCLARGQKTVTYVKTNHEDRKDMDFKNAKTKEDVVKALMPMSVKSIKGHWTRTEGKKICAKAHIASFLASLIASFRITGCSSVGATAWNKFQVLFAMHKAQSNLLYDIMYNQHVVLIGSRIGAALLQNHDFVKARECFLLLGASMAEAVKRLSGSWELKQKCVYEYWNRICWRINASTKNIDDLLRNPKVEFFTFEMMPALHHNNRFEVLEITNPKHKARAFQRMLEQRQQQIKNHVNPPLEQMGFRKI